MKGETEKEDKSIIKCKNCLNIMPFFIKENKIHLKCGCNKEEIIIDLNNHMNSPTVDSSSKEKKCDVKGHENEKCDLFCKECNCFLCNKCIDAHQKFCKGHHVAPIVEKNMICKEHNHKFNRYCKDCGMDLCSKCQHEKSHKIENMPELKNSINLINENINIINTQLNNYEAIVKKINDSFEKFKKNITILTSFMKSMIDSINSNHPNFIQYNNICCNNHFELSDFNFNLNNPSLYDLINYFENEYVRFYKPMNNNLKFSFIATYNIVDSPYEVNLISTKFNLLNKDNTILIIDNKEVDFSKNYIFNEEGKHTVKMICLENLKDLSYMFSGCQELFSIDLSKWNSKNVNKLNFMFYGCPILSQVEMSNWDVSNVTDLSGMFYGCTRLSKIDLSKWNTAKITNINCLFASCSHLSNIDISNWNTSKITDISGIFSDCKKLTEIDLSKWNISKVTDMRNMFYYCSNLKFVDISKWNTSKVAYMNDMFYKCINLKEIDLSKWNTSSVTNLSGLFSNCPLLEKIDISKWNINKVTDMSNMFHSCSSLKDINISKWNPTNVVKMNGLFSECSSLVSIDISKWNPVKVNNISQMFMNCVNLENVDISKWNLTAINEKRDIFTGCSKLNINL